MSKRRTKADIQALKAGFYEIVKEFKPMTVRQIFYQAVSRGLIQKSESEYKQAVVRLLTLMRKNGEMPHHWIADNTRWMRKPHTHDNMHEMLEESIDFYRRALWRDQNAYVEVWLEKEALSGVLLPITSKWDVPLMITRGYPSFSFMASAASAIADEIRIGKDVALYYFGDHDPSGVDIPRHVEQQLTELARPLCSPYAVEPMAEGTSLFKFERVAVNPDQIVDLDLQTRPTKRTDSRAKGFEGESVEVDAIHPDKLRKMADECITWHVNPMVYEQTLTIEREERETLRKMAEGLAA